MIWKSSRSGSRWRIFLIACRSVFTSAREWILGEEHDDPVALAGLLVRLDAESHGPGVLDSPQGLEHPQEALIHLLGPPGGPPVRDAVDLLHGDPEQEIRRVAGVDQLDQPDRRDRRHQRPDERRAGQGRVGDRRTIRVACRGAQAEEVRARQRPGAPAGEDRAGRGAAHLELVAADDLADVDEDRRVGVAELDDVQQRLLLPGVGHRRRVVQPVAVERHRSQARAAGEARGQQTRSPRMGLIEETAATSAPRRITRQRCLYRPVASQTVILISMGPLRAGVWCLVVLLVLVPTVRLAPGAGDHVSHHATMKASRAPSGVGRTTAALPSVVALIPDPDAAAPERARRPGVGPFDRPGRPVRPPSRLISRRVRLQVGERSPWGGTSMFHSTSPRRTTRLEWIGGDEVQGEAAEVATRPSSSEGCTARPASADCVADLLVRRDLARTGRAPTWGSSAAGTSPRRIVSLGRLEGTLVRTRRPATEA